MKKLMGKRARGQGITEFSLVIPVIIFTILGIVEIGRAMFTYAMVADAHRDALRQAEILGYDGVNIPYLDCAEITRRAEDAWFAEPVVTISYEKGAGPETYNCDEPDLDGKLATGDIMRVQSTASVDFLFFPFADLDLNFDGQRTLVKKLWIGDRGAGDADSDYDGLLDEWEITYWGDVTAYGATDNPDGDGCNNGCEENLGTDPTIIDVIGVDDDGDGMDDNWELAYFGGNANPTIDNDNDGCNNLCEFESGTNPFLHNDDLDADGLSDDWEELHFGDVGAYGPFDDPDGDGLTNEEEENLGTDPSINNFDTDGDGLADDWENTHFGNTGQIGSGDPDGDGCNNECEESASTDPNSAAGDSDSDGLGDDWENFYFGNLGQDGSGDDDGDGCTNACEMSSATNPNVHNNDTDGDGLWDDWELQYFPNLNQNGSGNTDGDNCDNTCEQAAGTDPTYNDTDSDSDNLPDVWENEHFPNLNQIGTDDPDNDSCNNLCEYQGGHDPNINNDDLDQDGLSDTWEMTHFGNLDQNGLSDPDSDGESNEDEEQAGTNPNIHNNDTDQDTLWDDWEMTHFGNLNAGPGEDPDGDGATNFAEQEQGTDPNVAPVVTVSGRLRRDNDRNCNFSSSYSGDQVQLLGSSNYSDTTDGNGNFDFNNVAVVSPSSTYNFTFPSGQGTLRSETARVNGSCMDLNRGTSSMNITIQPGLDVTIIVGYD